jgi:hypothetical protein
MIIKQTVTFGIMAVVRHGSMSNQRVCSSESDYEPVVDDGDAKKSGKKRRLAKGSTQSQSKKIKPSASSKTSRKKSTTDDDNENRYTQLT